MAWKRLKAEGLDKDGLKEAELRKKLTGKCSCSHSGEVFSRVDFPCPAQIVRRKLQGVGRVVTSLLSILYSSISPMSHLFCSTRNCYFRLFYVLATLELKQICEIILSLFGTFNQSIQKLTNSPSAITRKQRNHKDFEAVWLLRTIYTGVFLSIWVRGRLILILQMVFNEVMNKQDVRFSWHCFGGTDLRYDKRFKSLATQYHIPENNPRI